MQVSRGDHTGRLGKAGAGLIGILLFALAAALLMYVSLRAEPFPRLFKYSDYAGHFLVFGLFTYAAHRMFYRLIALGVLLFSLLIIAVCAELVQGTDWLPARQYDVADIMANTSGLLVGLVLAGVGNSRRNLRGKPD